MRVLKDKQMKRIVRQLFWGALSLGALYSCANIGHPDGGPKDVTPPRFLSSNPKPEALNNTKKKIVLLFDEFIKIENASEKVVVSPPQLLQPEIKASGKKISIDLLDSLKSNTTYTIDFSDAILDNNEGNPLGNFSYSFSTGNKIDTLQVSGTVLEASNLEPVKGILVGLHSDLNDSAFVKLPFCRLSRTDSRGHFVIKGIAPGKYHIYALLDADQNFAFNQKNEEIAFDDSLIIPTHEPSIRMDTSWVDSVTYDTVYQRPVTRYMPDNILLRAFKEDVHSQYLVKSERLTPNKFTFYFSDRADTLPTLKGLNFDEKNAFIIESNSLNDTINYWIKDSLLYKKDTLSMSLSYLYTDTLNKLVPRTDTLNLRAKQKMINEDKVKDDSHKGKKKKKGDKELQTLFLPVNVHAPSSMDIYDYITLNFGEPVAMYDSTAIHLSEKVDSLWKPVPFQF
ncbi:MAG: Ig-like domain-containing protein, partial [Bacteroidaceae bacterium]